VTLGYRADNIKAIIAVAQNKTISIKIKQFFFLDKYPEFLQYCVPLYTHVLL